MSPPNTVAMYTSFLVQKKGLEGARYSLLATTLLDGPEHEIILHSKFFTVSNLHFGRR